MDKDLIKALEVLDEGNPFASFLNKSTLSRVDNWIDTGSYVLNAIMSGKLKDGGVPSGRVTMIYGESQTGKSLFVQKILANAQKKGMTPVIFDTENAIEAEGAERLGLDSSKVKLVPIFNVEQCRNSIHKFLTGVKEKGLEGKFIIAIDSLGNLQSAMEAGRIEKDSTSSDMGTRARAIKSLMQTCTQLAAITKTPIIITNHVYDNPGEMHPSLIKTMSGGKSTIYMPSISVQISRKPVKEDEIKSETGSTAALQRNYVGILLRALIAKNRFIKQYLQGEIYLSFNTGVDKYYGLLELAVELDVLQQTGSTYMFNGEKIGYAKSFIKDDKFWEEQIIPLLQDKIDVAWTYSSEQDKEIKQMEAEASEEGGDEE